MNYVGRVAISLAFASISVSLASNEAHARNGSNVIAQSMVATSDIIACDASTRGQELIDCIGTAMAKFSTNVNRYEAPSRAPEIITMTSQAAGIRGKPKAVALATLNKLASVARGLATKGTPDFLPAYNAVADVFALALNKIQKK
jgi:hypothetical protein